MDLSQIIFLALIQGLTEFLPISSSAHLVLPAQLLGWADQGLAFDVAVHFGTLLAVLVYFRHQVVALARGWLASFAGGGGGDGRLAWLLLLATLPALAIGFFFGHWIEAHTRSILVIAATTILFGLLLQYADWRHDSRLALGDLRLPPALLIGIAQAVALIPGTSRSGITITAGLLLGLSRQDAARFSFLMAIPVIAAAACYKAYELISAGHSLQLQAATLGLTLSALSAFACIHLFMGLVERLGMLPFTIYRLLLGSALLVIAL